MKKNKNGFTLLELVIVIAVVAILAAILIPTFAGILNRSKLSNDTMICKNLNTASATTQTSDGKKPETISQSLSLMAENGFYVENLKTSNNDCVYVWDSVNNRYFVYDYVNNVVVYKDDNTTIDLTTPASKVNYWIISDTYAQTNANLQGFSVYLTDGFHATETLNITTGLDVGTNENIETINYTHTGTAQTVTICTNGGTLTIDAPNDVVNHYGEGIVLDIKAIASASYHEYGHFPKASIAKGRIVVEEQGEIPAVQITAVPTSEENAIKIETKKDIVISASEEVVETLGTNKLSNVDVKVNSTTAKVVVDEKVETTAVEINGQTATAENIVSIIKVATISELKSAILTDGAYIMLTDDITFSEELNIKKSVTIDGDGHTLTGNWARTSSNYPTIAINHGQTTTYTDVIIKNISVINNATGSKSGRPIETRGMINSLTLSNVTVVSQTCSGFRQPITIGGNQARVATINIDNCIISAGTGKGYGIVTFNPVNMTINDTAIEGWAAIYMKGVDGSAGSRGSTVVTNNCTFNCVNINSGTSNEFGAIVFEDGNINFTAKNCSFDVTQLGDQIQSAILFNTYWAEGTLADVVVKLYDVVINGTINDTNIQYDASNVLRIYSGTTVKDPSAFADEDSKIIKEGSLYVIKVAKSD